MLALYQEALTADCAHCEPRLAYYAHLKFIQHTFQQQGAGVCVVGVESCGFWKPVLSWLPNMRSDLKNTAYDTEACSHLRGL